MLRPAIALPLPDLSARQPGMPMLCSGFRLPGYNPGL